MKKLIKLIMAIMTLFALSAASDIHAADRHYQHLKDGYTALSNKDYEKSAAELSQFLEKPNLLTDYALLWRAKVYDGLNEPEKALNDISQIKKEYPGCPVLKNAVQLEIKIETKSHPERAVVLIERYLKGNPEDNQLRLAYARLLSDHGRQQEALREFTRLYISAGKGSEEAARAINTETLSPSSILERAKNLIGKFRYKDAELELISNITAAPETLKRQYIETIAMALFKQKKYEEASVYFKKAGMNYYEARSLFRAGLYDRFHEKVGAIDPNSSQKAAELILIRGLYYRRNGNPDKAISIFNSLKGNQFIAEEALWHIGWTHFLTGKYGDAYKIFHSLHTKYGGSKYLYWMARALESDKEDAAALYKQVAAGDDFYAFLSYYKTAKSPSIISQSEFTVSNNHEQLKRLAILLELNIEEAVKVESLHIAKHAAAYPPDVMAQAAVMLNEAAMYRHSILLAGSLPYSAKTHRLLYPYGHKEVVDEAARRFSINPLLILSVIREESRFQEDAYSPAGAIGLMQLMPQTAQKYSGAVEVRIDSDSDIFNVKKNILLGGYYVSQLVKETRCVPAALASYNAGEHVVNKWLETGRYRAVDEFIEDIPYDETEKYVKRVLKTYFHYTREANPDGDAVKFAFDCRAM
ncbi:MAG: transglycosylase SLT domain-containing protein [Candidatus Magnetominusculus sp. LBB02]|nr:transglycosylase SLT domain-containing protein [Candidatus Magnetominusculus sp. LBB02]